MNGSAVRRSDQGYALLVTVTLMLVISALAVSALNHASSEQFSQRNSKRKAATLAAAEAGLTLVTNRLFAISSVNQAVFDTVTQTLQDPTAPIDEPALIVDEFGFPTRVRTGTVDSAVALPIEKKDLKVPDGYSLNTGSQNVMFRIYRATVVAQDSAGGAVQVQAQYKVKEETSY